MARGSAQGVQPVMEAGTIEREYETEELVEEGKAKKTKSGHSTCPLCRIDIQQDASR